MWEEKEVRSAAKFFGPLTLFIITPGVAWMLYSVTQKELAAGGVPTTTRQMLEMGFIVLFFFVMGICFCRYGLGWFGGKKE